MNHTTRYRVSVRVFAPGELPGKPRERGDTFRSVSVEGPCTMVVPDIGEMITMTRKEIENYLEELVKKGHARVVALTESGKKRYAMTEEGLFAGEPNVEYALLVKVKERRVIMALKHPIDTPAEGEEAALNIFLCGSAAGSERENAVEIWNFVLPFDQRDVDFDEYTLEGYDPDQTELPWCRAMEGLGKYV